MVVISTLDALRDTTHHALHSLKNCVTRPERKTGKKISVGVSDDLRILLSGRRDNPHGEG